MQVRELTSLDDCTAAAALLREVWGGTVDLLEAELLRALGHTGGYVAGAYLPGAGLVGVSAGWRAEHGGPALHSHVTGVAAAARGLGVGPALKEHQRGWARERGLATIVWTFDPLVRRNAWVNLGRLGAQPVEYLVDFYGPLRDGINTGDETDRLLVAWPTDPAAPRPSSEGQPVVGTPHDVESLRRTDPAAAREWRLRVRGALAPVVAAGAEVGFRREDGTYVVRTPG